MRLQINFDADVLQSVNIHTDWQHIWFSPSPGAVTVADLLSEVWEMMEVDLAPNVKVSWRGSFIPVRSTVNVFADEAVVCLHSPTSSLERLYKQEHAKGVHQSRTSGSARLRVLRL